jgi:hypothetical protein
LYSEHGTSLKSRIITQLTNQVFENNCFFGCDVACANLVEMFWYFAGSKLVNLPKYMATWLRKESLVFLVTCQHLKSNKYSKKGKAIPLQVLTGPKGSRRLRLPDFKKIGI